MGSFCYRFKYAFYDLFHVLHNLNWFIVFLSLINLSVCIYEDQIGKFDWRQSYVGKIKFAQFDTISTAKKIVVATEENVLAALNLKTGQIVWRHVLESAANGNIRLMHVSEKVVTVSGSNPYLVRGWDSATGVLLWEWSLMLQNENKAYLSQWWVQQGLLIHMLPVFGSHIEVTMYNLLNGQTKGSTSKLPAIWINDGCILTAPYYTCISGHVGSQLLLSLDVTSNAVQIISKPLHDYVQDYNGNLRPLDGNSIVPGFVIDDKKMVLVKDNQFVVVGVEIPDLKGSFAVISGANGLILLRTWNDPITGFSLTAHDVADGHEVSEIRSFDTSLQIPHPKLCAAMCTKTAREHIVCRILLIGDDDSLQLMQQGGRILWSREEALANVVAAEFVDLPVSDMDAAIESEFDQKEGSIWLSFSRRLNTQLQQIRSLLSSVHTSDSSPSGTHVPLHRDYFNLHKIIVLVTRIGKIFGMDNQSGDILWTRYEPNLDAQNALIFTRRSARYPPHDAYLTVVGKHQETGNGLIISLNPIRGTLVGERVLELDGHLLQCAVLHQPDAEKLHALIVLYADETVQVLPVSSASLVENIYLYVADKYTAKVQGYSLKYDGTSVITQKIWSLNLGGTSSEHRIVVSLAKSSSERVHSAGRVLGDRSVLYKYINPNLVLFISEGPDPVHKDIVVATCVDVVSGGVVAAQTHRRARASTFAVHSDNFLAYIYYNEKQRRYEIASMELYEGKERWLPAGAAFTSFASDRTPIVERQSYILPATPTAAATTNTERSLTDKHVLLALSSGAIVEVPWWYLDPRRPLSASAEQREEGLMPYAPELPLPADAVLNYNRTLHRVSSIHTAPAHLESTSLVLATGLDIFYTRVAPSKTFDLLKDDFDYYLITIVLVALVVATYSTKYFASKKLLKMAWK